MRRVWTFHEIPEPREVDSPQVQDVIYCVRGFAEVWRQSLVADNVEQLFDNLQGLHAPAKKVMQAVFLCHQIEEDTRNFGVDVVVVSYKTFLRAMSDACQMECSRIRNRQQEHDAKHVERREFYRERLVELESQVTPASQDLVASATLFLWAVQNLIEMHSPFADS